MVTPAEAVNGIPFQGKDPVEHFQFYFRQHWIRLFWQLFRVFFLNVCLFAIGYYLFFVIGMENDGARRGVGVLLVFFFLLLQWEWISRFYRYFLYVTIVTDRKVHRIKKTLLAVNIHESVDLWLLQDITKSQRGIVQNLLGFGSLILEGQNQPLLRIHFTPHITQNHTKLMHLRERARTGLRT